MTDTLAAWLGRASGASSSGLRLLDRRERERFLSWSEIALRARAAAGALARAGVRPGDRVALVYPTGEAFFDAFFGAVLAGAVPTPLYPPVRLGRLDEYHARTAAMLRAAGARLLLTDRRVLALLGPAALAARPELGVRRLEELAAGPPPNLSASPDDLALVQFSSGTTVDPKPVALTHRAVCAQARALNALWPDEPGVTHAGASWLPLYHDMGLIGCVFPALERPATLTLLPPEAFLARPALWLRAISRHRATVSPAPNFAYALCTARVRDEEMEGVDLSQWRFALDGAEAVVGDTLRAFAERFAGWGLRPEALTPVYGLSEAALAVTFSDPHRPWRSLRFDRDALGREGLAVPAASGREIVSVGTPLPGFAVEVRADDGLPVPPGRVGRVWARGPSLMAGYLGRPEATAAALVGGWLDTGDRGFLHEGELFLTGRAKDVLIVRGANVAPEEVERAVSSVPGVRDGCVVAVGELAEGAASESLLVFLERPRGDAGDDEELARAAREAVLAAVGLAPSEVVVLAAGTLPRTSSGKLRRAETLARFRSGTLAPPRPVTPLRLATAIARSRLDLARSRRGRRDD